MKIDARGNRSAITTVHTSKTITNSRTRIDGFIANIHNAERLHSALGCRSPLEFINTFAQNKPK